MHKNTMIIRENELSDELRQRCEHIIDACKQLPLSERRMHYEDLNRLLNELIKNKNKNFEEMKQRLQGMLLFETIDLAAIPDDETEMYIRKIFEILTNELD